MNIELCQTFAGDMIISNADEDAPLVKIQFCNETINLSDEHKIAIGELVFNYLVSPEPNKKAE